MLARPFAHSSVGLVAVLVLLAGIVLPARYADPDLFARVAVGRLALLRGDLPQRDPFSFSSDKPWIDHEWLSGVAFALVAELGGDRGLLLFKWILAGLTVSVLWCALLRERDTRRRKSSESSAESCLGETVLFAALVCGSSYVWLSTVRAQVFTFFLLTLLFLGANSRSKLFPVLAPAMFALWANLHGGVALGLVLYAFLAARAITEGEPPRAYALSVLACALALFCTPYGFDYLRYLLDALRMPRPAISEWRAVPLGTSLFVLSVTLVILAIAGWRAGKPRNVATLALYAFTFLISIAHLRFGAVFFFTLAATGATDVVCGARLVAQRIVPGRVRGAIRAGLACALSVLVVFAAGKTATSGVLVPGSLEYFSFPVDAVEHLSRSGLSGRLLVGFNEGSFALWRLFPKFRVSLDGRYEELYSERMVNLVRCALERRCERQRESLSELSPDVVLALRGRFGDDAVVSDAGMYRRIYDDERFEVYSRTPPPEAVSGAQSLELPVSSSDMWEPRFFAEDVRGG